MLVDHAHGLTERIIVIMCRQEPPEKPNHHDVGKHTEALDKTKVQMQIHDPHSQLPANNQHMPVKHAREIMASQH